MANNDSILVGACAGASGHLGVSDIAISARGLHFAYDNNEVIRGLDLDIARGQVTTLIGANGCGKSTLLNLLTKNLVPASGQIYVEGKDASAISRKEFAQTVAIVHQKNQAPADLSVRKLVEYGRVPYAKWGMSSDANADASIVDWALETTGVFELAERAVAGLSGGQMQRVWIAMALAQDTRILMLDEPTTYLDIRYQLEILQLVRRLNAEHGLTVVMVLHDINQALYYSDAIVAMKDGAVLASGCPNEVVTSDLIAQTFGVDLRLTNVEGQPYVLAV
jgi:iron complex transport system ATP-binding protein